MITHAHTQQDSETDARHWTLSEAGRVQAQALAQQPFWPAVDCIFVSSEAKTRLTIEPVLEKFHPPLWVERRFDELRRPGWVVNYAERVRQTFANPTQPAGDWETAAQALDRFLDGILLLRKRFVAGETLALVGHGLTLSLYRAHLLKQPRVNFEDWQNLSFAAVALAAPPRERLLADFQPVAHPMPRNTAT